MMYAKGKLAITSEADLYKRGYAYAGRGRSKDFLQWEYEDGSVRIPEEENSTFDYPGAFTAAGKRYATLKELCYIWLDEESFRFRDIYGREWIQIPEFYPCFDEYDRMHENRYYRWFYRVEGDKLCCVYRDDGLDRITVTEDVAEIRRAHIADLIRCGWLPDV